MKSYFILFIIPLLFGCLSKKQEFIGDSCPEVLFSKNHRVYITTEMIPLTLNNISYRAETNNYNFANGCFIQNNKITGKLSILFIVTPEKAQKAEIIMPYYIALLNNQKNIVDIQYYKIKGNLNKNVDKSSYIKTEITATQDVIIPIQDISDDFNNKLLIGFMLNKEKLDVLN